MSRALLAFLFALLPAGAQEYNHRLSAAIGVLNPAGGSQTQSFDAAPLLSFDYGNRFFRYGQADVGVDIGFATGKAASFGQSQDIRRNIYFPRFGYRAIIPLLDDRVEASIGAGASYSFYKPPLRDNETWLVYGQLGANYAIDADKRYRGGVVVRWYRDPVGAPVQQWVTVGFEFLYSFGR